MSVLRSALGAEVAMVGEISGDTDWAETLICIDEVIHLAARVRLMGENFVNQM